MYNMDQNVFAFNPRLKDSKTGKIAQKYHRGYAEPGTGTQIDTMLGQESLNLQVSNIRNGEEKLKEELVSICPHYSRFNNNHRAQADIIPEAFTFKTCIDVDDISLVDQAIARALEVNSDEHSDWQGMVEYIERSARLKVHIWIRIPVGMTIEEAQRAFCEEIEIPYDESCITPERFIYMTGDAVYRADSWLQPLSEEEVEERREAYLNRGLDVDGRPLRKIEPKKVESTNVSATASTEDTSDFVAPDKRTRYIFNACLQEAGLQPSDLTEVGGRHNALKSVLSVGANQLLSEAELNGVLSEMMPENWQDKNIRQLVSDFYSKYNDSSQKMTVFQRQVFAKSRRYANKQETTAGTDMAESSASVTPQSPLSKLFASALPPRLPAQLPRLVKAVTSQTPDIFKATVAQAIFPALATYPKGLSFIYTDNQPRELRINCLIVAGTGGGKDSCIRQPLNHIMADLKERDEKNRARLAEFNEQYNSKASNKEKPKRPDDLVIQSIKSDITKAALNQKMEDAQGAPLYVRINELEQWDKIEGSTGRNNQFTTLKLIDDEDNDFGADRAGTQSVTASGSLHLNWNANTTPAKAQRYFKHVLVDGPISRLVLATIPEPEIGAEIPVFGKYDKKYDDALSPYLENLKKATGTVTCKQAYKMAQKLKDEVAVFARLSQDKVFDNLTHRALVHAFRKACLLYAANGMKWEKSIENFCRWSMLYDLWIKLRLWGDMIRNADNDMQTSKHGPRNLLEQIETKEDGIFTYRDAVKARLKNSMTEEGTGNMLSQWKRRGHIIQMTDDSYKKV